MNMEKEVAFILGALEDGNFYSRPEIGDYTVEIEQKNKEWLENLSNAFQVAFKFKPKITERKNRNVFRLRVHSKKIFEELEKMRRDLEIIQREQHETQIYFLRGVFDAEGSVHKNKNRITFSNKKEELIILCQTLLTGMGIKTGNIWNYKWGVKVLPINGRENLEKFNQIIGFSHPEKRRKLENKLMSS